MKPIILRTALLFFGLALASCRCAADELDPELNRPFGRRIVYFAGRVADIPTKAFDDVACRLGREGDYAVRYFEIKGDEFARTGDHLAGLFPKVGDDIVCRTGRVGDSLGSYFSRAWDDLQCLPGRTWNSVKVLE